MGVFEDKKYDQLDWISQATEPIESHLNEVLVSIPEVVDITYENIVSLVQRNDSRNISLDSLLKFFLVNVNSIAFNHREMDVIRKCFTLEVNDASVDFENKVLNGSIKLIRHSHTLDEKLLQNLLGKDGIDAVAWISMRDDCAGRINEIFEILGDSDYGLSSRSVRKKRAFLVDRLRQLFKANEWNIKDVTLANKVGYWIKDYIVHNNLAALSNLCRLKVMTHKGQPIYSMEEVQ